MGFFVGKGLIQLLHNNYDCVLMLTLLFVVRKLGPYYQIHFIDPKTKTSIRKNGE